MKCITCSGKGKVLTRREGSYRAVRARCDDCYGTGEMFDFVIAERIHDRVYDLPGLTEDQQALVSRLREGTVKAIKEWLADPDTERSEDETIESLAAAWVEAAHRES